MSDATYVPSPADWVREQVEAYERSGGTEANTLRDSGIPIVVFTMTGNKSGVIRKVPLMRVEHEGSYALVASYGGRPSNPVWHANLQAQPEILVQDGPTPVAVTAREVHGDERAEWWERAAAVFPTYREYQQKTQRLIPVWVASPA